MNRFINSLFETMTIYFSDFIDTGYQKAWFLFIIILMIYTLTVVKIKSINIRLNQSKPFTFKFYIIQSFTISSIIVSSLIIMFACIMWANSNVNKLQFLMLLNVLVSSGFTIIAFVLFRSYFVEKYPLQLIKQALTRYELNRFQKQAKFEFQKLKYYTGFFLVALLAAFLNFSNQPNLICIVFDNNNENSEYVNLGKDVLRSKILDLNKQNQFVISWFSSTPTSDAIPQILQAVNYQYLAGSSQFFDKKRNAANQFAEIPLISSAPLYETIWSNYLVAKEKSLGSTYKDRVLIIITSGKDELLSNSTECFLCCQEEFANFYNKVALLNLGGRESNILARQISNCKRPIVKDVGLSRQSYTNALNEILSPYQEDRNFIYLLIIIILFSNIVILLIQPKKG